jgi:hypothetical protein
MITIVKVYDKQVIGTHREYCGRPGKGQAGLLGNPFWMNDESQRNEVCDKYHEYFHGSVNTHTHTALYHKVQELVEIAKTQDIELACFCQSPNDVVKKRCHTETIKVYIKQALEDEHILAQAKELEQSMY